jgi:NTE family protein
MSDLPNVQKLLSPVSSEAIKNAPSTGPERGIALCLSGGGYRAMLFHLGTLWRLNRDGMLPKLTRISSVSGGSITSGTLGANWSRLDFDANGVALNFEEEIAKPLRHMAHQTIFDRKSVLTTTLSFVEGLFNHDQVIDAYRKYLFGTKTLQDLPGGANNDYTPRFVFNATNLQSGSLWRFSKPYMADWRVGMVDFPNVELAVAVAASSAFPIGLPPVHLKLDPTTVRATEGVTLHVPPYTEEAVLVDGGVYDNMGIETAWKEYQVVLVSDAGGISGPQPHPAFGGRDPARVFDIIDNQVGSLRKRQVIGSYQLKPDTAEYRDGAYWGIGSDISHYGLPPEDHLPCPFDQTIQLARVETVLQTLDDRLQERLVNWGFAICDVALRRYCIASLQTYGITLTQPQNFPYPAAGC